MQSSLGERITPGMTTAIVGVTGMPNFTTPTLSSPPSFLSPMTSQDQSRGQHHQSSDTTRPALLAPTPIRYKVIHYPSRTSRQGHGGSESSQYVSLPHVQTMTNPHNNNHYPLGYPTNVSLNEGINRSLSTCSNPAVRECSSTAVPAAEKVRRSLMFENANGTEIVAESGVVGKENVHNIISQTTSNLVSPSGKETGHNSAPPQPFSLHQLASQSSREDYGQVLPGINSFDNHSATAQNENGSTQSLTSNVISPTTINKNLASAIHPTSNNATKSTDCLNKIIKKTAQEVESQDEEDFKQSELKFTSSFRKPIPLASTNFTDMSLESIARPTHTLASSQKLFNTTNNKLSPSRNLGSSTNLLQNGNRSPRTQTYHACGNKAILTNNRRKSLGTHSPSSSSTIMKIELSKPPTVIVNERRSPSRIGSPRSFVGSFLKQKISPAPKSVGVYPPTPSTVPPTGQGIINPQVRSVKVVANPHIRPVTGIDHRPFVTDNSWCPLSCQSPIHSICGGSPRSMTPHHIAGTPSSTRSSGEKENAVMKEDPMTTLSPASAARRQQEFLETYANQKEDEMGSPQEALSTQQPSRVQFGDNEDENDILQVATVGATTASEGACSSPTSDGQTPNHQRREGLFGSLVESSTSTPARKNSNLGTQNASSSHGVFGTGVDITQPQTTENEEKEDLDDSHPLAVFQKLNSNASSSHANVTKSNFSRFALASNSTSAYHSRGDADVFLNLSREADDENDGANDSQITASCMMPKSSATSSRQRLSGDDSAPSANLLPTLGNGMNGSAGNNSSSRHPTSTSSGTTASTQVFQSTVLQHSADGASNLLHAQHNGAPNNNSSYNIHAAQAPILPQLHESSRDTTNNNNNSRRLSFTDLPHPKDRTDTSSPSPNSKSSKGPVGIKPLDANLFAENPSRNVREEHSAFSVPASRLPPRSVQHSGGGRHSVILFDAADSQQEHGTEEADVGNQRC